MARSTADRLAGYQRRYRNLAAQLADIGYIAAGSLAQRHNRCGKPNCHCHGNPPQLQGRTGNRPPKSTAKPSTDASPKVRPNSTRNGSTTTVANAPSSPRCEK
jgi:hypothetical protein